MMGVLTVNVHNPTSASLYLRTRRPRRRFAYGDYSPSSASELAALASSPSLLRRFASFLSQRHFPKLSLACPFPNPPHGVVLYVRV